MLLIDSLALRGGSLSLALLILWIELMLLLLRARGVKCYVLIWALLLILISQRLPANNAAHYGSLVLWRVQCVVELSINNSAITLDSGRVDHLDPHLLRVALRNGCAYSLIT